MPDAFKKQKHIHMQCITEYGCIAQNITLLFLTYNTAQQLPYWYLKKQPTK